MYQTIIKYLKATLEPYDLGLLDELEGETIIAEYGLKVFTGFESTPTDLMRRVSQASIEDMQKTLELSFMQARKAQLSILSGRPFSFVILLRLYMTYYPTHDLLKHRALMPILVRLNFIRTE